MGVGKVGVDQTGVGQMVPNRWTPPLKASDKIIMLGRPSNLSNLYSVSVFACVATPSPYQEI